MAVTAGGIPSLDLGSIIALAQFGQGRGQSDSLTNQIAGNAIKLALERVADKRKTDALRRELDQEDLFEINLFENDPVRLGFDFLEGF